MNTRCKVKSLAQFQFGSLNGAAILCNDDGSYYYTGNTATATLMNDISTNSDIISTSGTYTSCVVTYKKTGYYATTNQYGVPSSPTLKQAGATDTFNSGNGTLVAYLGIELPE